MRFDSYAVAPVALAVDLVNSYSPIYDRDDLPDELALELFLEEHDFNSRRHVSRRELAEVRRVRDRLREVFMSSDEESAASALNSILTDYGAQPTLTSHDGDAWHVHFVSASLKLTPNLAVCAAMALMTVVAEHGFDRFHVCEGKRCLDVFVDLSRNRSRRYCSPAVCGNRASVAAYKARQRAIKRKASA